MVERYILKISHFVGDNYVGSVEAIEEYTCKQLEEETTGPVREQYHKAIDGILISQG
jgi:hypothetical protein